MAHDSREPARTALRLFPLFVRRIDSLPAPRGVPHRVADLLSDPGLPRREVTAIARDDPALVARVLRIVNSPLYGLEQRVSTASHAVAVLGTGAIRRIAGGPRPASPEGGEEAEADRVRCFVHAVAVASAAEALATAFGFDLPEEAFVAGLLHDLGRCVLDTCAPDEYLAEVRRWGLDGAGLVQMERRMLGLDHCQVGAIVAERWNLPRILRDVIGLHHEAEDRFDALPPRHGMLLRIVAAADRFCTVRGVGAAAAGEEAGGSELDAAAAALAAAAVAAARKRLAGRFGGGRDLLDVPGSLAESDCGARGRRAEERPLAERLRSLGEVLRDVGRCASAGEVVARAVGRAPRALDFDRVLWFELDQGRERLRLRACAGESVLEADPDAAGLPVAADGAVGTALHAGTAVRADNWSTDGGLLSLLGHSEAVVAAMAADGEPAGLLCADCSLSGRSLGDGDVALLGRFADALGLLARNRRLSEKATELQALAIKDELTGVNNRRNLMDRLATEIERALRYDSPLSLVMVDIDHFKVFNDTLGHLAGDTALAEVAHLIVASSRDVDVIGRYGGEEFMAVLPETFLEQGIVYAERLRKMVEEWGQRRAREGAAVPLTISAGVTAFQKGTDDLESLLRRVDAALYAAKARGRNRVCVA